MRAFSSLVLRAALWGTALESPFALWALSSPHSNNILSLVVEIAHTPALGLLTILTRPFRSRWNDVHPPVIILLVVQAILFSAMFLSIFWARQKRKEKKTMAAAVTGI